MNINKTWDTKSIENYKTAQGIQKQLRQGNSAYLCSHPEIQAIIRVLIHELINENPANFYNFVSTFFTCSNTPRLTILINQQLKLMNKQRKKSRYAGFDPDVILKGRRSTDSLISKISIPENVNAILRYALVKTSKTNLPSSFCD
ncbi:uncharacterized protein LOC128854716 [Anastrepha ludens]|uniref:uncharacterized protein LOC128854716 n=1 Tax=Anastrepha ludens TaxID=28586 RepID=UPI0023B141A9|nr:uncharacterized protein LOC128854716 [Anastrepha ludens]